MKMQNCTDSIYLTGTLAVSDQLAKPIWDAPTRLLASVFETLIVWQRRINSRRHLADMDARLLRDMGMTREDADREAGRFFWRS